MFDNEHTQLVHKHVYLTTNMQIKVQNVVLYQLQCTLRHSTALYRLGIYGILWYTMQCCQSQAVPIFLCVSHYFGIANPISQSEPKRKKGLKKAFLNMQINNRTYYIINTTCIYIL